MNGIEVQPIKPCSPTLLQGASLSTNSKTESTAGVFYDSLLLLKLVFTVVRKIIPNEDKNGDLVADNIMSFHRKCTPMQKTSSFKHTDKNKLS